MKVCLSGLLKFCASIFLLTIFFLDLKGQEVEQAPNILPPSPTAAELGKYGFVPVGMATGTAQVGVPLYTFKTRNIEIPISLSYQSNGSIVDQNASWVGLNWSLEAGGVVTRIVRDDPDEDNLLINDYKPFPENFDANSLEAFEYLKKADEERFDTEPDIFAFNFLGYTGKFVLDREGRPVTMPYQNLVIERLWNTETYTLGSFIITTPDGVRYTFGAVETSKTYQAGCAKNYEFPVETAWYLTKIEHPTGDVVFFYYQTAQYFYYAGVSQFVTTTRYIKACSDGEPGLDDMIEDSCPSRILSSVVSLERIESEAYGTVEFTAPRNRSDLPDFKLESIIVKDRVGQVLREFSLAYTFSSSSQQYDNEHTIQDELKHRMFLTSLTEQSAANKKTHSFEYNDIDGLPPRLSYAQDHWGYFNGKDNNDFVPRDGRKKPSGQPLFGNYGGDRSPDGEYAKKGMLAKVTYPTGGYTKFFYEANTYVGSKTIYNNKFFDLDKTIPALDPDDEEVPSKVGTISEELEVDVAQEISFTLSAEKDGEIDTHHDKARITIDDLTTGFRKVLLEANANGFIKDEVILTASHRYRFTLDVSGYGVHGFFGFEYKTDPQQVSENMETGGVRIAKIFNHDYVTGNDEVTNYFYAKHDQLTQSSGKIGSPPQYYSANMHYVSCGGDILCDFSQYATSTLHSSSVNAMFQPASHNIYYQFVTTSRGSDFTNGAEEHEFIINFDLYGQLVWGVNDIKGAPLTNFGWDNGLETYSRFYKKNGNELVLIKQIFSDYDEDAAHYREIPGLVVRKSYDPICWQESVVQCDETYNDRFIVVNKCFSGHTHTWKLGANGYTCKASGADNRSINVGTHPCYGSTGPKTIAIPGTLEYLDAVKYVNISRWFYLKKKIETTYDDQGSLETVIEYNYDNPTHAQLTHETVSRSDGKQQVTIMKYPDDYGNVANMQVLRDKHIVGVPIKTESIVDDNKVAGNVMLYNDNGQPLEVYSYEPQAPIGNPAHNQDELIPAAHYLKLSYKYDDISGNVKEITPSNSPIKSYLWGYDNTLPIAEIIKASVENVATDFNVFHTSFESDETQISTDSRTGRKSHAGVYVVKSPKINGDYKLTYWEKLPGGNWIPKEISLTITNPNHNDIIIGAQTSVVDEVRLYPVGAMMTTYTHDPLVGVTSVTDPNNLTTYYHYDPLGRLDRVKDSDGNLVKHYKYHYYNESEE